MPPKLVNVTVYRLRVETPTARTSNNTTLEMPPKLVNVIVYRLRVETSTAEHETLQLLRCLQSWYKLQCIA
jgi:hypothetical protein